ncbi:hypothetical protein ACIKTA_11240 [Hansschlegelia beijingensis]|uniref:hypothetical protein n=1 Tax=Hansschlegelia beijingensis TaxID=1133344 RepID=UPI00382F9E9B
MMVRNFVLAAALAAGAFAVAPAPASAGVYLDVGGGPYYGHRHHYRPYYRPHRPYYRPYRAYRSYGPRCRTVSRRYWNGYRYVVTNRRVCRY